jgi:geranylgeranyl reductase family protein
MGQIDSEPLDVLVVGAGPAGCSAAAAAAGSGARVILVDAKARIGTPVRCAEFVPRLMAREVEIPDDAVAQAVDGMTVHVYESGDGLGEPIGSVRSPGFILNREVFERGLGVAVVEAGVRVLMETRASREADGRIALTRGGSRDLVVPRVVVSAEGPVPKLRTGAPSPSLLPSIQYTLPLANPSSEIHVFFSRAFRFGYAWVFPKGDVANVGLGCAPEEGRKRLTRLLGEFVSRLVAAGVLSSRAPACRTGGWIPVWGPAETARQGNVLFAGDAAGLTDPVTGAGIWPAIASGRLAGECAARAVEGDGMTALDDYDEQWRELFYHPLRRAAQSRRRMERDWDSPDFVEMVRAVWPGL